MDLSHQRYFHSLWLQDRINKKITEKTREKKPAADPHVLLTQAPKGDRKIRVTPLSATSIKKSLYLTIPHNPTKKGEEDTKNKVGLAKNKRAEVKKENKHLQAGAN